MNSKTRKVLFDALDIQASYYKGEMSDSSFPELNDLIYYSYNHPEAPIFLPKKDYEVVVLMSGGIDSYIAYKYALTKFDNVKAIYIDYGYPYASVEKEAINNLKFETPVIFEDYSYLKSKQQAGEEKWGEIFPGRNWILSIIASQYITDRGEIWMAAIGGEVKELWGDKSELFFSEGSKHLSNLTDKRIRITSPFKELTKGEIIHWYISQEYPLNELHSTVSCHYITDYTKLPCGKCMGCAHRYVGMHWNNLYEPHRLDVKAFTEKLYKPVLNSFNEFSPQRIKEIEAAIQG